MESTKVEDYIKAIYHASLQAENGSASTGDVAQRLQVTPGSVTTMLQRLAESDLVIYQSHRGAKLTESGKTLALNVLRRHRLLELFLVKTLGLTWDEIHDEAENLEHAVSERLVNRIDQYLGFPDRDPHGDPIPNPDGTFRTTSGKPLAECPNGTRFVLEQVVDQAPDFLRYLSEGGLEIASEAEVVENQPSAGILVVRARERQLSISCDIAQKILVRTIS